MIRYLINQMRRKGMMKSVTFLMQSFFCCLMVILSGLIVPDKSHALTCPTLSNEVEVVVQNIGERQHEDDNNGLNVRNEHNTNNTPIHDVFDGDIGTVKAKFQGPIYIWYYVEWKTPIEISGWSVGIYGGNKVIASTLEASRKDKLVEVLFGLEDGEADLKTKHDYNDYECYPKGFNNNTSGYKGGHSGWDVTTTWQADPNRDAPFYSLTNGLVIRAKDKYIDETGATVIRSNPPNIIAILGDDGITTLYLHARAVDVSVGQRVNAGTTRLGRQGEEDFANGIVTGPHVHIEVRKGRTIFSSFGAGSTTKPVNIDPIPYLYESLIGSSEPDPPTEPTNTEPTNTEPTNGDIKSVVSIEPDSVESPAVGQELKFSLKIEDGIDVAGFQATIAFDRTALRHVESAKGGYLLGDPFFQEIVDGNSITLITTSLNGESDGDGTLATLVFEVIAVKESTLKITDVRLSNIKGQGFTPRVEHAEIIEPKRLREDVNGDGTVNIQDLVLVASNFGKTGENDADINNDDVVNIQDLVLVASKFGSANAAPTLYSNLQGVFTASDVQHWLSQARQLSLTDTRTRKGIHFLEQLLTAFTPKQTLLLPNYPNPFNPETWIPYQLAEPADVNISIYAADGKLVRAFALGHQPVGIYESKNRAAYWDGKNAFGEPVASGVYFYTLTAGNFTTTRKMLIRK